MRMALMWAACLFVFGNFCAMIAHKQALLRDGQTVYLELAPVDPRSVLQGDYMNLNYAVMNKLNHDGLEAGGKRPGSGAIIIRLDGQGIGAFARYDDGRPLAAGEFRLKYHHSGWRAVIGAESYFIPEGTGEIYGQAKYGKLKLEPDGTPLIVALCDQNLKPITSDSK